jgi:hypothetical protein
MTTKKQNPAEQAATAKFTTTGIKPADVSGATQKTANIVKQNPAYAQHPEVQQGVTTWLAAADKVDQSSQKVKAAHLALTAMIATLALDMAAWKRAAHAIVALINTVGAGSAEAIKQWGFATTAKAIAALSSDPPQGLRATYSRALVLTVRWNGVSGHRGYLLQMGDGTPQGWGAPIPCPMARFSPQGLAPGQKVAFRVAVQRKNGLSNWSDVLTITVR